MTKHTVVGEERIKGSDGLVEESSCFHQRKRVPVVLTKGECFPEFIEKSRRRHYPLHKRKAVLFGGAVGSEIDVV